MGAGQLALPEPGELVNCGCARVVCVSVFVVCVWVAVAREYAHECVFVPLPTTNPNTHHCICTRPCWNRLAQHLGEVCGIGEHAVKSGPQRDVPVRGMKRGRPVTVRGSAVLLLAESIRVSMLLCSFPKYDTSW